MLITQLNELATKHTANLEGLSTLALKATEMEAYTRQVAAAKKESNHRQQGIRGRYQKLVAEARQQEQRDVDTLQMATMQTHASMLNDEQMCECGGPA